ncbi:MAG: preprotein translocase subunit SecA, partial [Chitinophagaceae bacterium]
MRSLLVALLGGNKSEKDLKRIKPYLEKIHTAEKNITSLSNDELRRKTDVFKTFLSNELKEINFQIQELKADAENLQAEEFFQQDEIYKRIDAKEKERNKQLEKSLMHLLPEAFAIVKETARRFTENETLISKASELDKDLSIKKEYISIDGENAIYKTTWNVAGNPTKWKMVHYDVQLIGGIVLHEGKISEMATGEGKTLVSTLPAYLNALAGLGVHIVTVNDYLAKRDAEWNATIFEWLGITVDCIDKYDPHSKNRNIAYNADITYGTNNEFGFDYLRDNMVHDAKDMVQRKHHYAIIDEVDSVLIDDARTPLIISGPIAKSNDEQQYFALRPRIQQIVDAQKRMVSEYLGEAKKLFAEGKDKPIEGGIALMRAQRGFPKNAGLLKFLNEPLIKSKLQKIENYYLAEQEKEMPKIDEGLYFVINEKNKTIDLTTKGIEFLATHGEDKNLFILPDLGFEIEEIEKSDRTPEEKFEAKEVLIQNYTNKADRLHSIQQLLKAYTLFEKDVEYVVINKEVKIVDEQTGRIMEGRRYSDGLHQAIEAKENVKIEAATQTYATITLQNFFRMYHKLSGMTGTAETEAGEFMTIYKLDVVSIPTNIIAIRKDHQDLVYKTKREKYKAILEEIENLKNKNRPVLVGTTSVEVSELISKMLQQHKIPHNILNAKQHAKEAQVVAEAGIPGTVTIATNMAGRGTDIKINDVVRQAGGLAIIGTERHESRRIDRQLRGRSGRQGDPGSTQFFISLEDDLMRIFGSERLALWMDRLGLKEGEVIQHGMITKSITRAQKKVEENNFGIRKRLLEYDDIMNKQRSVIYSR